ncbi:aldo/keto reductase [Massilia terrae]|uniref:Aldo/keto reductase n=1 Tax=Massilia terrae TaxID=1811224 RepID=A0ABT2D339_9BURK|nr:aldo/keto reductase [Massilia terrae]MCS0660617.1 aldo/keto reductase [Massilia terrae]
MEQRALGQFRVGAIGVGCMNLSHAYGQPPARADAARLLLHALDLGVNHFDTAALYGFGANEELVGEVLGAHRSRFTLVSKCGMQGVPGPDGAKRRVIDGRPETIRQTCEDALRRLRTDVIDLYYLHRWDKAVPIEDSVGAMAELKRAGKIRAIGLSEVSAATLRRAHSVHPIAAVQSEYSLWSRHPELGVLEACRELGAALVAFSPVGRGFLAGAIPDARAAAALAPGDLRRAMPRFQGEHLAANLRWLAAYEALAKEAGCTPAQLALAWLLQKAPHIVPIPGTTKVAHLEENLAAAEVTLPADLVGRVEALVNADTVSGGRYAPATQAEIDTETYPSGL